MVQELERSMFGLSGPLQDINSLADDLWQDLGMEGRDCTTSCVAWYPAAFNRINYSTACGQFF